MIYTIQQTGTYVIYDDVEGKVNTIELGLSRVREEMKNAYYIFIILDMFR